MFWVFFGFDTLLVPIGTIEMVSIGHFPVIAGHLELISSSVLVLPQIYFERNIKVNIAQIQRYVNTFFTEVEHNFAGPPILTKWRKYVQNASKIVALLYWWSGVKLSLLSISFKRLFENNEWWINFKELATTRVKYNQISCENGSSSILDVIFTAKL